MPSLAGHFWTLAPYATSVVLRRPAPAAAAWSLAVSDPTYGRLRLTGKLAETPGARRIVVVVHGLGGSSESHYVTAVARVLARSSLSSLYVNLRGADRRGEDFYHAGLTSDLGAILASPEVARYEAALLLGFSLGGHVALLYACEAPSSRLRAVAAVCSPLDLGRTARHIDRVRSTPYRRHVLRGLKEMYAAQRRPELLPLAVRAARGIQSVVEWDERVVARRHGFAGAADYYAKVSAGPRLSSLSVPALYVGADHDPMVTRADTQPSLGGGPQALDVRWSSRGGHVGFPRDLDLGTGGPLGLEPQLCHWLERA